MNFFCPGGIINGKLALLGSLIAHLFGENTVRTLEIIRSCFPKLNNGTSLNVVEPSGESSHNKLTLAVSNPFSLRFPNSRSALSELLRKILTASARIIAAPDAESAPIVTYNFPGLRSAIISGTHDPTVTPNK